MSTPSPVVMTEKEQITKFQELTALHKALDTRLIRLGADRDSTQAALTKELDACEAEFGTRDLNDIRTLYKTTSDSNVEKLVQSEDLLKGIAQQLDAIDTALAEA